MAFSPFLSFISTLVFYSTATFGHTPKGVTLICHDRYLLISLDHLFIGRNLQFEAVDEKGAHPITEEYAAKCGYSIRVLNVRNNLQLRASYFSCHADHTEVDVFKFNFNLIAQVKEKEVVYALHRSCSPPLPWFLREVSCEVNYMEVSVKSEMTCPQSTRRNGWDNLKFAYGSSSADWQVTFQQSGEQLPPMSLKEARSQGYVIDLMGGRLVFRTSYGQPHSFTSSINGVPVEVIHATLFSRQSWLVLLVDLVAACSMFEATYEDEGYMLWETPDVLYPGVQTSNFSYGLGGKLMQPAVAEAQGYIMEKYHSTIQISVPYDVEGCYRKSVVSGGLFEFFTYDFYLEQMSIDEEKMETRIRTQRTLHTPLLKRTLLDEDRTILQEQTFTIYLGNVPQDVQLISVELNNYQFQFPLQNVSIFSLTMVVHPNDTNGYILMVPFHSSLVIQRFLKNDIQFQLNVNYTLMVTPENQLYNHSAVYVAILPDLSPPEFKGFCLESSISFKLEHKRPNSKWEVTVGSYALTPELAAKHGFIMSNNSQTLQLEVPLVSDGCEKKNFSLQGFTGTFEIQVRDRETSEIQSSTSKTCPFVVNEYIVCSTNMWLTAVVDLSLVVGNGGVISNMTLLDKKSGPIESDAARGMFSFPMNGCGSTVMIGWGTVTYENEILYSKVVASDVADRVFLQCTYPVSSLYRLFSKNLFVSDSPGAGRITRSSATGLESGSRYNAFAPQQNQFSSSRFLKYAGLKTQQLRGQRFPDGLKDLTAKNLF